MADTQHITQPAYTHTVQTIQQGLFPVEYRDRQGRQHRGQLMRCCDHLFAATTRQTESCQRCRCTGKPGFIAQRCQPATQVFQQCSLAAKQGETALHFEQQGIRRIKADLGTELVCPVSKTAQGFLHGLAIHDMDNQFMDQGPRCRDRHAGADTTLLRPCVTEQHTGSPPIITDRQRLLFIATAADYVQRQLGYVNTEPVSHAAMRCQGIPVRWPGRRGV